MPVPFSETAATAAVVYVFTLLFVLCAFQLALNSPLNRFSSLAKAHTFIHTVNVCVSFSNSFFCFLLSVSPISSACVNGLMIAKILAFLHFEVGRLNDEKNFGVVNRCDSPSVQKKGVFSKPNKFTI